MIDTSSITPEIVIGVCLPLLITKLEITKGTGIDLGHDPSKRIEALEEKREEARETLVEIDTEVTDNHIKIVATNEQNRTEMSTENPECHSHTTPERFIIHLKLKELIMGTTQAKNLGKEEATDFLIN